MAIDVLLDGLAAEGRALEPRAGVWPRRYDRIGVVRQRWVSLAARNDREYTCPMEAHAIDRLAEILCVLPCFGHGDWAGKLQSGFVSAGP